MNTALLLIDIQNDYFPGGAWELSHADEAAAQARLALGRFREQHRPVFHVRHINTRPGAAFFLPDTPGSEIHGAVKPLDGEPVIIKHAPDAFFHVSFMVSELSALLFTPVGAAGRGTAVFCCSA